MLSNLRAVLMLAVVTVAFAVPASAGATAETATADSITKTVMSGAPVDLELRGRSSFDAMMTISIAQQPAHGTVEVLGTQSCTYPDAKTQCVLPVRYRTPRGYVGADSFTFLVESSGSDPVVGTVALDVQGRYPVLPSYTSASEPIRVTAGDGILTTARELIPGSAFVQFDDTSGLRPLTVGQDGAALISYSYSTPGTYTLTVINRDVDVEYALRRTVIVSARSAPQPLQPTITVPPNTPGQFGMTGLVVNFIDSGDTLTGYARSTTNFQAGQFGFTPGFTVPPIIVPNSPGLQFTPPPAFTTVNKPLASGSIKVEGSSDTTSLTAQISYSGKSFCNSVDCVVRRKPHAARSAAPQPKPQLWYIDAAGSLQPVIGSSKPGAVNSTNITDGVISVTLDDTSVPRASILDSGFRYIVITPRTLTAKQLAAKAIPGKVVGWPGRATVLTGAQGGCPSAARGACTVRLVATATRNGVRKVVGVKVLKLRPGQRAPLNFALRKPGRWRYAEGYLNAAVQLTSTTPLKRTVHQRIVFRVRAKLG